jgi:hypothetical protein
MGLGLFARQNFKRGDVVFEEKPLTCGKGPGTLDRPVMIANLLDLMKKNSDNSMKVPEIGILQAIQPIYMSLRTFNARIKQWMDIIDIHSCKSAQCCHH